MQRGIKIVLLVLGSTLAAFGIGCCLSTGLGVDPVTVFIDGISVTLGISVGVAAMVNSGLILLIFCVVDRHYIKWGTFVILILFGNFLNIFCARLDSLEPYLRVHGWAKFVLLGIGIICAGVGFATCIAADLGPSAPDIPVLFLCDRFKIPMKYAKIMMDAVFTVVGFLLGGIVGVGTILCILCIGFVYQLTSEWFVSTLGDRQ